MAHVSNKNASQSCSFREIKTPLNMQISQTQVSTAKNTSAGFSGIIVSKGTFCNSLGKYLPDSVLAFGYRS